MSDCRKLDPLVTPYVDGALGDAERAAFDAHVRLCHVCASRVAAVRSVRALLPERRAALCGDAASGSLRARCAAACHGRSTQSSQSTQRDLHSSVGSVSTVIRWQRPFAPLALAASLTLLVTGAFVYEATAHSARILAAELTADHVKCFVIGPSGSGEQGTARVLMSHFGWRAHLPADGDRQGLELVGARLCVYGEGRAAHIMYRHHGTPVSVFMLPGTTRAGDLVDVLGHEAAIWSVGDRTFVLISRAPRAEVEQLASFVHAGLR